MGTSARTDAPYHPTPIGTRHCPCGQEFMPATGNQQYCTPLCAKSLRHREVEIIDYRQQACLCGHSLEMHIGLIGPCHQHAGRRYCPCGRFGLPGKRRSSGSPSRGTDKPATLPGAW